MRFKRVLIIIVIIIVFVIFSKSFLTQVEVVKDGSLDWLKETKIAHRGLYNNVDIVENSLSAINATIKAKENLEIDLQMTKDNVVVVLHDSNLKRLTGLDRNINELTYEEVKVLKLLNTEDYIPTLEEVLKLVDGSIGLLIEIKNKGSVGRLEELTLEALKSYEGKFAIQSFNPFVLEYFSLNAPEFKRGQLVGGFEDSKLKDYEKFLLSNFLLNFKSKPNFIAHKAEELPNKRVDKMKKKGLMILAWTVILDGEEEITFDLYDNIIYERKQGDN